MDDGVRIVGQTVVGCVSDIAEAETTNAADLGGRPPAWLNEALDSVGELTPQALEIPKVGLVGRGVLFGALTSMNAVHSKMSI